MGAESKQNNPANEFNLHDIAFNAAQSEIELDPSFSDCDQNELRKQLIANIADRDGAI